MKKGSELIGGRPDILISSLTNVRPAPFRPLYSNLEVRGLTPLFSAFFSHQGERHEFSGNECEFGAEEIFSKDLTFKSEMADAMLIFLVFPINFLEEVIQRRERLLSQLIGNRSRWEDMQNHFASCKAGLIEALKENDDYLNLVREKLAENPIAMITESLDKSHVMKELDRENLLQAIIMNLEALRSLLTCKSD